MSEADQIIASLGLMPHPEGGYFAETWRHRPEGGGRGAGTAIYYLLKAGQKSAWHRVRDADEIWHHYAGAPLLLAMAGADGVVRTQVLGADVAAGQRPQLLVPAGMWQSAVSQGAFTLVGCTVSPAFEFEGFEMAPPGFRPGGGD